MWSTRRRLATLLTALSVAALAAQVFTPAAAASPPHDVDSVAHDAHGDVDHGHGAHHDMHVNWMYGFLGEKEGVTPSLLYRPKGMPMPVGAYVVNSAILFFLLFHFGKKPVAEGLVKRKARIVAGMDEAAKMKAEAAEQLAMYEKKLKHIDEEIERVRREMRESAEAERARILAEAKERRTRMERDAKLLVEQELKAAREELVRTAVASAVSSAEQMLAKELSPADHERMAEEYLGMIRQPAQRTVGGRA